MSSGYRRAGSLEPCPVPDDCLPRSASPHGRRALCGCASDGVAGSRPAQRSRMRRGHGAAAGRTRRPGAALDGRAGHRGMGGSCRRAPHVRCHAAGTHDPPLQDGEWRRLDHRRHRSSALPGDDVRADAGGRGLPRQQVVSSADVLDALSSIVSVLPTDGSRPAPTALRERAEDRIQPQSSLVRVSAGGLMSGVWRI